jgi:hypothetical protein
MVEDMALSVDPPSADSDEVVIIALSGSLSCPSLGDRARSSWLRVAVEFLSRWAPVVKGSDSSSRAGVVKGADPLREPAASHPPHFRRKGG